MFCYCIHLTPNNVLAGQDEEATIIQILSEDVLLVEMFKSVLPTTNTEVRAHLDALTSAT